MEAFTLKVLKYLLLFIGIFVTGCSSAAEPATSMPAASAPTTTPAPAEPTATHLPEPTATPTPEPGATPTSVPTATLPLEPTVEATAELVSEHDEAAMELVGEHEAPTAMVEVGESELTSESLQATWQKLEPGNEGPGPRYQHAMAYNAATNQVFVFGGRDGSQVYNDVWVLDLATLSWRRLAVEASSAPPARFSAVIMVDTAAEKLYVTTGQQQGGSVLGDIWRLDLQTEIWEDLSSAAGEGPVARYGAAGGELNGNLVVTHGFGTTRYDDTWLFNTTSRQWENITPAGEVPLKRCLLAAATTAGGLVLHGGCSSGFGPCPQDDTWVLDTAGQTWRQISGDVQPAGRQHHSLTSLGDQNRVILFGGQDGSQAARDDVWLLDLVTDRWQPVEGTSGPEARYQHGAVWTPQGMLIYGGQTNGPLGDIWLLTLNE